MGLKYLISLVFFVAMSFAIPLFAGQPVHQSGTIIEASVGWDNLSEREKMLENVPKWQYAVIESMFSVFLHPERYQLPLYKDERAFNLQFINAFWGPIDNPFIKYARPSKIFAFVGGTSTFYMAPLVQDANDGNFYVFDKIQMQPMLLANWMAVIQNTHGTQHHISFNVCNGYGNFPEDKCEDKSYQNEISDIKRRAEVNLKTAQASIVIPSAHRESNENWVMRAKGNHFFGSSTSNKFPNIFETTVDWSNEAARKKLLKTVATWSDFKAIQTNFEKIRDLRYFHDEKQPGFLRRISWLYPDDGCWTRASAVIKDLFGPISNIANEFSRPSKIFAFGNLCANTPNSPKGKVTWWYHTAPIIRDKQTNQSYVLDPSIDPSKPLTVEKWVEQISSNDGACKATLKTEPSQVSKFNICDGYGTGPYSSCHEPSKVDFATESSAVLGQSSFRQYERERQIELGRDPDVVLGGQPPWGE
jgi:hypothetical protein